MLNAKNGHLRTRSFEMDYIRFGNGERTPEDIPQYLSIIRQGYNEDLGIYIRCLHLSPDESMGRQAYLDVEGKRFLICYTSEFHARNEWRSGGTWVKEGIQDVLNNMFNKDSIVGLAINPDEEKSMVIVLKRLLQMFQSVLFGYEGE